VLINARGFDFGAHLLPSGMRQNHEGLVSA
jgi:hypothetical protein